MDPRLSQLKVKKSLSVFLRRRKNDSAKDHNFVKAHHIESFSNSIDRKVDHHQESWYNFFLTAFADVIFSRKIFFSVSHEKLAVHIYKLSPYHTLFT